MKQSEKIKQYALAQVGGPYVYGATGKRCTPAMRRRQAKQYPQFEPIINKTCPVLAGQQPTCAECKYNGKIAHDCAQLTSKAAAQAGIRLPSGATTQWQTGPWAQKGDISGLPYRAVAFVYRQTPDGKMQHTGVYLGDGTCVDARGHAFGVLRKRLEEYRWTHYAIPIGIDSDADTEAQASVQKAPDPLPTPSKEAPRTLRVIRGVPLMRGEDVRTLQHKLIAAGYSVGRKGPDGIYGWDTYRAVLAFQMATWPRSALDWDGVVGPRTWAKLGVGNA